MGIGPQRAPKAPIEGLCEKGVFVRLRRGVGESIRAQGLEGLRRHGPLGVLSQLREESRMLRRTPDGQSDGRKTPDGRSLGPGRRRQSVDNSLSHLGGNPVPGLPDACEGPNTCFATRGVTLRPGDVPHDDQRRRGRQQTARGTPTSLAARETDTGCAIAVLVSVAWPDPARCGVDSA